MIAALVVSQALLFVAVVGLSLVCLALARQIGVLHERIAPAGALSINQRLKVGDAAPKFSVEAIAGETVRIGAEGRGQLLFFLSPDCPICKTLLPVVRSVAESEKDWLSTVFASDGHDVARHLAFRRQEKLEAFPYIVSETVGRGFGVGKLPYAVLIDEAGKIASMGIVNSREHIESLFEAKERGVASLQDFAPRRGHQPTDEKRRVGA